MVSGDPPVIAKRSSVAGDVDRARKRFALGAPRRRRPHRALDRGDGVELPARRRAPPHLTARRRRRRPGRAHRGRTRDRARVRGGHRRAGRGGAAVDLDRRRCPLGLATLFALALMYGVGYVAGGYFLGRLILEGAEEPLARVPRRMGDPAGRRDRPGARRARRRRGDRVRPRLPDRRRVPRPPGPRHRRAAHRRAAQPTIGPPTTSRRSRRS